ncbi:MAG TPA: hypothetical protein VNP53_02580 [Methylomirabilota bacterium]|nr:hypothetical protein [Methylomirabilota bacterium]
MNESCQDLDCLAGNPSGRFHPVRGGDVLHRGVFPSLSIGDIQPHIVGD